MTQLHVRVIEAKELPKMDTFGKCDCFAILQLNTSRNIQKTRVIPGTYTPVWNEDFHFPLEDITIDTLTVFLKDDDKGSSDDPISLIKIPVSQFPAGDVVDKWYSLTPVKGVKKGGQVRLKIQIAPLGAPPFVPIQNGAPSSAPQPASPLPSTIKVDATTNASQPVINAPPPAQTPPQQPANTNTYSQQPQNFQQNLQQQPDLSKYQTQPQQPAYNQCPQQMPPQQNPQYQYPPQQPGMYPQQPQMQYPQQTMQYQQNPMAVAQPPTGMYPQQQPGYQYPQQQAGYPPQQPLQYPQQPGYQYPPQQAGYPQQPGMYPPQQGYQYPQNGYPQQGYQYQQTY